MTGSLANTGGWIPAAFLALLVLLILGAGVSYFIFRKKRLAPAVVETLSELIPDSNYVSIPHGRIHYVQAGAGSDLVLIHGIGASVFAWRLLFPLLQGRYRVTALDLPGFGSSSKEARRDYGLDSQARAVHDTLTALGIESAVLVGSSMGGTIALWMAKLWPDQFSKVVTLAPATDSRRLPLQLKNLALFAPLLKRALNKTLMRRLVRRVVSREALVTDAVVEAYMRPFLVEDGSAVRSFWAAMALLADRRLPSELKNLKAKVLILFGARDLLVSRRSIDRLMRTLPDARLLVHPEGGHHVMEDEPEWTAKKLEEFILGV